MSEEKRYCVDVLSPVALRQLGELESMSDLDSSERTGMRAILVARSQWPNGSTLRARFMGGSSSDRDTVKQVAGEWMKHGNIKLEFGNASDAQIRISFVQDGTSWSYVGTDCLNIPRHAATMNFGWPLEQSTILHEFGHALGLGHEHQNPEGGIQWNEEAVIRDLSGSPNFWDEATIRHNVLNKYSQDQIKGTQFDNKSIMLYTFPAHWTRSGLQTPRNTMLSDMDKQFIGSEKGYPFPKKPDVVALNVIDTSGTEGDIGKPGEEDLFRFSVKDNGRYTIETEGATDVVMKLFGPDSQSNLVAEDDDSGEGRNARIVRSLLPGDYFVQVRHFNSLSGTGPYRIKVLK